MRRTLNIIGLLCFICYSLIGITTVHATKLITINKIEIIGNERVPLKSIQDKIPFKEGFYLVDKQVNDAIKDIYSLGQFQDIKVNTISEKKGIVLQFIVDEKPVISHIEFDGNKKIKESDMRDEITQRKYHVLNEKKVMTSIANIKALYDQKRFYLADIDYYLETAANGDTTLVFEIDENRRAFVQKIQFIGNHVFSDDELRSIIRTKKRGPFSFMSKSGEYDENKLEIDTAILNYHYLNHGYLKAKIQPPKLSISNDKRFLFVIFHIHEGNQYRFGNVTLTGDVLTTSQELRESLESKTGDIYSHSVLGRDIMNLTVMYGNQGYAFANIIPNTVPNDNKLTADIHISISKGNQITVEKINIFGNDKTRDKVIRRELAIVESDRFSEAALQKSKENLMRLGYFEDVNIATPRGSRDDTVNIDITVTEKSTRNFNIGVGFSSIDQFMLNASVSMQNSFGTGISSSLSAELSKRRQMFMLSFNDPYFLDTNFMAGLSVYRSLYHFDGFKRESFGGSITLGRRFLNYLSASLSYNVEDVEASSFSLIVPQIFKQNTDALTSALSLTLSWDNRNNRVSPTKGLLSSVTNEVSGTKLGGDNDYYRLNAKNMLYVPMGFGFVFRQFSKLGYIKSLNDSTIPLFERYFSGGPYSLRGFNPNSIGPSVRIPNGPAGRDDKFVYGGDKLMLFIAEIETPIYDKAGLRGVIFFDAGNAYAENENYSFKDLRMDYGFGIRWMSPMGALRFEWGLPINRRAGEDKMVFNFTIGNFF